MSDAALFIEGQVAAMKIKWPLLVARQVDRELQSARWVGRVWPQYARYVLDVRYRVGYWPEVRVVSPTLIRLPGNAEGELPHVYPPADDPVLCLFDPRSGEWTPDMEIAVTTVPWSLDWLTCYEHWLMIGRWMGGGRHASRQNSTLETPL
jgi:hypothetical protein